MSMLAANRSKPLSECIATAMPENIGQIRTTACLSVPNRAHAHVKVVGSGWAMSVVHPIADKLLQRRECPLCAKN